jgi:transcription initiation factor TFIIB
VRYNFSRTLSSVCPECGSRKIIEDDKFGDFLCLECGCVVEKVLDRGPEWRAFEPEERKKRERVGPPQGPTSTIFTEIGFMKSTTPQQRERIQRWQKFQKRITGSGRNIRKGISEIERMSSQLDVPQPIRERVAFLYMQIRRGQPYIGRKLETIIASLIYHALREARIPRSLNEIAKVTEVEKKEIAAAYRALRKEFLHSLPAESIDFVPRLVSELKLSGKIRNEAIEILKKARSMGLLTGKHPVVMAATAVYIAASVHDERVSQKEIAMQAGVTEVSIRNHYKELAKMMGFTLNVHKGRKKFQPAFFYSSSIAPTGHPSLASFMHSLFFSKSAFSFILDFPSSPNSKTSGQTEAQ